MWMRRKQEDIQLNLTPLIDVVFLLLIFFMVTTSFKKESKITLELPEATGQPIDSTVDLIEVSINRDGDVFINGQGIVNTQIATIQAAIESLATNQDTPLVIKADKETPYQSVISVMDAVGKSGYDNVTLAIQQLSEDND